MAKIGKRLQKKIAALQLASSSLLLLVEVGSESEDQIRQESAQQAVNYLNSKEEVLTKLQSKYMDEFDNVWEESFNQAMNAFKAAIEDLEKSLPAEDVADVSAEAANASE